MITKHFSDPAEINAVLDSVQVGTVATIDDGGSPYMTPVNYVRIENALYFHSSLDGRKLDNIERDGRVCFSAYAMHRLVLGEKSCDCSVRYGSVICFGRAELMPECEEKQTALRLLSEKYFERELEPPTMECCGTTAVVKIVIEKMTGKRNVDNP